MAWYDLDFFFFRLVLWVTGGGLCAGALGGGHWDAAAVAGTWIPISPFSLLSSCSRSLKGWRRRSRRNERVPLGKGRRGLAVHFGLPGLGGGGLRVCDAIATTDRTELKSATYRPSTSAHHQNRGSLLKSDARIGARSKDGEQSLYPFSFFPIWAFACAWILGHFGSGFIDISEVNTGGGRTYKFT
jgi:hypothetical protein